jgi:hypothetical protein
MDYVGGWEYLIFSYFIYMCGITFQPQKQLNMTYEVNPLENV